MLGEVHLQVEGQVEILTRICLDTASATTQAHLCILTATPLASKMSADGKKEPPPYIIPESQGDGVRVYHAHTPFTPPPMQTQESSASVTPVYTGGGGGVGSGFDSGEGKKKYVSYDVGLGTEPGMTTCSSCQQQVMTNVTYKAGTYAWLMCLLFICCGLVLCCCLIPFFMKRFKDAYHTCPRCNRVLHIEKRKCCK